MKNNQGAARLYDTILSIPGMNETVKMDVRLSRKHIFFLNKVIELGLQKSSDGSQVGLIEHMPEGIAAELLLVAGDLMNRAGLAEMNEKLKAIL